MKQIHQREKSWILGNQISLQTFSELQISYILKTNNNKKIKTWRSLNFKRNYHSFFLSSITFRLKSFQL
jgi:hypothetical protein